MGFKKGKVVFIVFFILACQNTYSQDVASFQDGDWDLSSSWSPDPVPMNPWVGSIITIDHTIEIANNDVIDLNSYASGVTKIILNGDLVFNSNSQLVLPPGTEIVFALGATITARGNSSGTLIDIGGSGVWGNACAGCSNEVLTGPGTITQASLPSNPLPVELLYFTAKPTQNLVNLNWSTASELNNDYFTIEKSNNGRDFVRLGEVAGNGTTNLQVNYSFTDSSPYLGLSYYRLSQTDYDGTTEVFPVVSVLLEGNKSFSVGPNPVSGSCIKLKISEMGNHELLELNIVDLQGRLVEKKQFKTDSFGNVDTEIQLQKPLQKGTYIFELISGHNREYQKVAAN